MASSLPYVPTSILSSDSQNYLIYIVQPSEAKSGSFELLTLNTTQTFDVTHLPFETLSSILPFGNNGQNTAINPTIDEQGNILVYTGDCRNGTQTSSLWQFRPTRGSLNGNGTWQEIQLSAPSTGGASSLEGSNYLASAFSFSSITNGTAGMYVFGGMCPKTSTSSQSNWTQNADYSNEMLAFEPSQSSFSPVPSYNFSLSSSRGAPIAEAGFTITSLAPTFSDSSHNQTQSVNQNFVLIGGHTQQAFINMSQVALFSLPEQSWSFISVDAPSSPPPTDLAARTVSSIDSRSGHTATLTPDGKKIVVFGGWVGDINTPANPQLAVLELGQGFGGTGDWQWAIPSATGNGPPPETGIYGHGAAMIAGDILLVTGGYQIQTSGTSNRRRASSSSSAPHYLFNTTSSSFISSYTHPALSSGHANPDENSNASQTEERVGLGVGLTVGIFALISIVVLYFWYSRRLKRRRDAHDEDLRKLAAGAQRFHLSGRDGVQTAHQPEMTQINSASEDSHLPNQSYPWNAGNSTASTLRSIERREPEAARTGLLFEIPSPTRGLRKSLHSRGSYQPTPRYEDGRRVPVSTIHPIDERDEDNEGALDDSQADGNDTIHRKDYQLLSNVPVLDPFRDPPDSSRTPSPQSPEEREAEVRTWISDWTEAEAMMMMNSWGRQSPEKTDRTSSTLSDMSAKSLQSYSSLQRSTGGGGPSRSVSQRSAGVFSSAPLRSTNNTTPSDDLLGRSNSSRQQHGHGRTRSLTSNPGISHHAATNSDASAAAVAQVLGENDTLLGGNQPSASASASAGPGPGPGDSSPSKIGRRAKGWMGSMRRVFIGGENANAANTDFSSPVKDDFAEIEIPHRAASIGGAGGIFSQRKQGAKDWETPDGGIGGSNINSAGQAHDSIHAHGQARKDTPGTGNQEEGDWDIESAVERRVVQVMFTVPKEKLRVVNKSPGEGEGDGESMLSSKYEDAVEDGGGRDDAAAAAAAIAGGATMDKGKGKEEE